MSREDFKRLLGERVLFLDGAYGTEFFKRRLVGSKEPIELLNINNPEAVLQLQSEYVQAGVDFLLTNTFSANRHKLASLRCEEHFEEINVKAVELARKAAEQGKKPVFVLGDISSTGGLVKPLGDLDSRYVYNIFKEQAKVLFEAGVDGFIIETMSDIKELKLAYLAIRDVAPDVPLLVSMTFEETGVSVTGTSVENYVALFNELDVDAIGANCTLTPDKMLDILKRLAKYSVKPIFIEPNAGKPTLTPDGKLVYKTTPEEFGLYVQDYAELGANIIGGCCGTGPEHIAYMVELIGQRRPRVRNVEKLNVLTDRTHMVNVSPFLIIGERINASGKKKLHEHIRMFNLEPVLKLAKEQEEEGAQVIDVNFGIEATLGDEHFRTVIQELDRYVSPPVSFDIQNDEFLDVALFEYPGRPLINSSKANKRQLDKKVELLKRYGGMLVVLAMDNEIPESAEERYRLGKWAVEYLEFAGISRERVFVDPLVMPFGAKKDFKVTLNTIEMLSKEGIQTIIGLSNFSFGLPDREALNASFLAMALDRGLTAAILNTKEYATMKVLSGMKMLKFAQDLTVKVESNQNDLVSFLLRGSVKDAEAFCFSFLETMGPLGVIQEIVTDAMEKIGQLYAQNKIFLPHLILAAETIKPVLTKLLDLVGNVNSVKLGKVLLATVEGDIHDIGKRIVATVLESNGFEVVDIGKDVPAEKILEAVKNYKPDIVGLSAMMTTTVLNVGKVVKTLREAKINIPIIAGGASMNEELAQRFGCHYARDAQEAVKVCKRLMEHAIRYERSE
ncbi:homocysteine methyltransferase [Fervidobacterium thailandense]|uniref:Methionine synthase n=1 Tax=Fervidobacterium thailandense TaxID=1008305 RepID=A0A1E3G3Q1_9BACT|nr:homocysteine S-methyltransferase family protein [Fervidobacterium thailandense]ODN30318.1 homocysteine methyltransferase [Fervidobacterium thailandense]